jgi:nucleoside phosphorylase
MFLIAAAMEEELNTAKLLFPGAERAERESLKLWRAVHAGRTFGFLKTGVGPRRSAERLREAIRIAKPSQVLVIGYAGALDPYLKLGSLVAVDKAKAFVLEEGMPAWERVRLEGEYQLSDCDSLVQAAKSAGFDVCPGDVLTSPYVLGNPEHKRFLYEQFHAAIVDMETAALASVAHSENIPVACIRVVSDEAEDTFLSPFSHDPSTGIPARAKQLWDAGMVETYREWKLHSAVAKDVLGRFMSCHLLRESRTGL